MTFDSAKDALHQHFTTRWAALHATIQIHLANQEPLSINTKTDAWLRFRILPSFARRVVVGGQTRRQGGQVVVSVFVPTITGEGAADAYVREIENIWETAQANGLSGAIHLGAPEAQPGIEDPDIPAFRTGVAVSFEIDHTP